MSISEPIITNIHIPNALEENDIHTLKMGARYWVNSSYLCSCSHNYDIYDDFMMTKTLNWINWKYK